MVRTFTLYVSAVGHKPPRVIEYTRSIGDREVRDGEARRAPPNSLPFEARKRTHGEWNGVFPPVHRDPVEDDAHIPA